MNNTIQLWVKKIKTNDPNQVSELYHKNGLLLGTFSSIERYGKKLILDYFEKDEDNPMIGYRGCSRYYSDEFKRAFKERYFY